MKLFLSKFATELTRHIDMTENSPVTAILVVFYRKGMFFFVFLASSGLHWFFYGEIRRHLFDII